MWYVDVTDRLARQQAPPRMYQSSSEWHPACHRGLGRACGYLPDRPGVVAGVGIPVSAPEQVRASRVRARRAGLAGATEQLLPAQVRRDALHGRRYCQCLQDLPSDSRTR